MDEPMPAPRSPETPSMEGSDGMPIGMPAWAPRALAWLLLGVFVIGLLAGVFVRIPRTLDGPFVLSPVNGAELVRSPVDGFVEHARVEEGQAVRAGQVLFTIRPTSASGSQDVVSVTSAIGGVILRREVASEGGSVQAGQVLIQAVSNASPLWAVIDLQEEALANVKPDQTVQLLFAAYPHYQFGARRGIVRRVHVVPAKVGETYCLKAYAELLDEGFDTRDGKHPFRAGLHGEARIVVSRTPLIANLFGP